MILVWIETREGESGPNGIPPALYTLTISDFLTPKRAKTELIIERPLKVILDVVKLKIGQKFLRKLLRELHLGNRKGLPDLVETEDLTPPPITDEDILLNVIFSHFL